MDEPGQRLGSTPIIAGLVATVALGYLVVTRLGLPTPAVAGVLLSLAVGIVGANRCAVRGTRRDSTRLPWWRRALGLGLAMVAGTAGIVASQDMELRDLVLQDNHRIAERERASLPSYPPAHLIGERAELQATLDTPDAEDPQLAELNRSLDTVGRQLTELQDDLACEVDGTCGSLRAGARDIYEAKADIRDDLLEQQERLRSRIADRTTELTAIRSGARRGIARIDTELMALERDHSSTLASIEAGQQDTGPLRRVELAWRQPFELADPSGTRILLWAAGTFGVMLLADVGLLTLLLRRYRRPRPGHGGI